MVACPAMCAQVGQPLPPQPQLLVHFAHQEHSPIIQEVLLVLRVQAVRQVLLVRLIAHLCRARVGIADLMQPAPLSLLLKVACVIMGFLEHLPPSLAPLAINFWAATAFSITLMTFSDIPLYCDLIIFSIVPPLFQFGPYGVLHGTHWIRMYALLRCTPWDNTVGFFVAEIVIDLLKAPGDRVQVYTSSSANNVTSLSYNFLFPVAFRYIVVDTSHPFPSFLTLSTKSTGPMLTHVIQSLAQAHQVKSRQAESGKEQAALASFLEKEVAISSAKHHPKKRHHKRHHVLQQ